MATPTSSMGLPAKYLRDTLSQSAAFRTFVSAANATAALSSIYYGLKTGFSPPFAVVEWGPQTWDMRAGGSRNYFDHEGMLRLRIVGTVSSSADSAASDAFVTFVNTVGEIVDDLQELAGTGSYLDIRRLDTSEPARPPVERANGPDGDYVEVVVTVEFGSVGP